VWHIRIKLQEYV
jgi:hypothetical protein